MHAPAVRWFCVHISHNNLRIALDCSSDWTFQMFNNIHAEPICYDCTEDNGDSNSDNHDDDDDDDFDSEGAF